MGKKQTLNHNDGAVYFAGARRRPIAFSTAATSKLLGLLAEDGHTFSSARKAINFDSDGEAVLDRYIELGFGDVVMSEAGIRY